MHEMALMRNVVDMVLQECERDKDITKVVAVRLTIGEMRDVIDEYVPSMFRFLARDTIAEDAQVSINHIPMRVRCLGCGDIFHIDMRDQSTWSCPRCGAYQNYRLFSGNEFRIDKIEVERSPVPAEKLPEAV
jgi:hydrogenase nickel incorporation protein HypA/HybF